MTNVTVADVERIQKQLDQAKEAKARLEGAQASELETWQRQWGINSPEELEASIAKLRTTADTLNLKAQGRYNEILALLPVGA